MCMYWVPTKVLDCERGFKMKYSNSRMVCSSYDLFWIDMYAYDGAKMHLRVCRSIWFHCTWPVGFIIITHFNEVASDRATRSQRVMFHWESAKTATRWFIWVWLEYQMAFTKRILLLATLGSIISAMFTEIDLKQPIRGFESKKREAKRMM